MTLVGPSLIYDPIPCFRIFISGVGKYRIHRKYRYIENFKNNSVVGLYSVKRVFRDEDHILDEICLDFFLMIIYENAYLHKKRTESNVLSKL